MSPPSEDTWSRQRFTALLGRPDEDIDLAEAALLIACEEYPSLEPDLYLARLDAMGEALAARLPESAEALEVASTLREYLFRQEGFHGNSDKYYDPRNSFLNEVLDRRTGIPISLSAVYIEVARRAGVPVFGVGLPGHFVVKLQGADREVLVDPFHGGAVLTPEDCQARLNRIFEGRVKMEPRMLAAVTPRQILDRMLRNLKALYVKEADHPRTLGVLELLLRLDPEGLEDLRDRGLVYAALDCYAYAARDLEAYLAGAGRTPKTDELVSALEALRHRASRIN
ncbi:MAG TPA: transglutaminase-like domain-containing protein [Vicinamibacteria bacterium]|nr:transglutaminase-like domain-containing protein [Vicinamibacteria bacterium]